MRKLLVMIVFLTPMFTLSAELPAPQVPNPEAFKGWEPRGYTIDELDFNTLKTKKFVCDKSNLLHPMSKDQSTKKYHVFNWGGYDHAKLRGDSEACLVPQKSNLAFCLKPDTFEYAIMSDTFRDECGNSYRGYWEVQFLTSNESMGTLCSLGRTFYDKPNSPGEIVGGDTYAVERSRFSFFSELFASDR